MKRQKRLVLQLLPVLLFWLFANYFVLAALAGNTESSIAQSTNILHFVKNVALYLIFFYEHTGGLLFDVAFGLLPTPLYLLYFLGIVLVSFSLLVFYPPLKHQFVRSSLIFGAILTLVVFLLNQFTIKSCIVSNQWCLISFPFTPIIVGLYGWWVATLIPVAIGSTFKDKRFIKSVRQGFMVLGAFVVAWLFAIYIPQNNKQIFSRQFSGELAQKNASQPPSVDFLVPTYMPTSLKGTSPAFTARTDMSQLVYDCAKPTGITGLTIVKATAATLPDQSVEQYEQLFKESHAGQRYMEYVYDAIPIGDVPGLHITVHDQMTHDFSGRFIFYTGGSRYELIANPKCIISPIKDELTKMATTMIAPK